MVAPTPASPWDLRAKNELEGCSFLTLAQSKKESLGYRVVALGLIQDSQQARGFCGPDNTSRTLLASLLAGDGSGHH